jgi:hypothetical protein
MSRDRNREIEDGFGCAGYGSLSQEEKEVESLRAELATEREKVICLRKGLERIRDHKHCESPDGHDTIHRGNGHNYLYMAGAMDGHRCCAAIAREILEGK